MQNYKKKHNKTILPYLNTSVMATIITQLLLASHSTPNYQVVLLCTLAHLSTPKNFLIAPCYNSSAVYPFLSHPAIRQPNSPRMGHTSLWRTPSYTIHFPKGGITLQRLGRRLPSYDPALGSANESRQTLMKVGLRHRMPVNVVFVGNFQHVEKFTTFENEGW